MPDAPDRAIDGLARRQHGVFHRRQAVRNGFTKRMIDHRLDIGAWVRLLGSLVYALPSHRGTWLRQCMAATLSVPAGAISGPAAAALLGFPDWPRSHIEVVTRHGTTTRSPFGRVRRSSTIGRFVVVEGIRVVSPADCLLQLAPRLDVRGLGALLDDVARTRRRVLDEVRDRYAALAMSRLPGLHVVRGVLDERGEGYVPPPGELERRLHRLLDSIRGMPTVEWEATPPWLERGDGRVDALVPDWKLVVEADGRDWHTRVLDFERDRWRDAEALANGYATVRLTWLQLTSQTVWCRNTLVAVGRDRSC